MIRELSIHIRAQGGFYPSKHRLRLPPRNAAPQAITQIPEQLCEEAALEWKACATRLEDLGLEPEKAHVALGKAFGWSGQAFWRQERVEDAPDFDQIASALEFLATLGINSDADVAAVIQKCPEVLGLDVALMQANVEKLKKAYFLKGTALAGAIKRKPRVLGSTVDCQGNCAGECTRCFAQF